MSISKRYAERLTEAPASRKDKQAANLAKAKTQAELLQKSIDQSAKDVVKAVQEFLDKAGDKVDYAHVGSLQEVWYRLLTTAKFIRGDES